MRFDEVYGRFERGSLSCEQAADVLGVSLSTFRRYRRRYEAEGASGLYDRRLGKVSARRAPVDEVMKVLELFETRYDDFTVKHFHEKLVSEHGVARSYSWTKNTLQEAGKVKKAKRRGAHRRKRPRRPMAGMMLHQDGSTHRWIPGLDCYLDLIATMDDASSEIYSAFLVEEEGTMSSFQGLAEVIAEHGLFCSLYTDRASHYFHTPEAGGKVDKDRLTQLGRALAQLGIEHIAAYSPEARGRSERAFGTLQDRLPKELRLAGVTTVEEANRFIAEVYLPQHNARFAVPPEQPGSAFVADRGGAHSDILCVHEERVVGNDNTVRYKGLSLQLPPSPIRHHFVKARVRVHEYTDATLAVFHGPKCLARYTADGTPIETTTRQAA
ncbi:MAG: ISNCY family transposase [bacterium]|nr:ISNCY family transposase [bacterium]